MSTLTQSIAILHHDRRLAVDSIWESQSTYTEAGAVPAVGAASLAVGAVQASGTVELAEDIHMQVVQGGPPGATSRAARCAWRRGSTGPWHGQDPPVMPVGHLFVELDLGALTAYRRPTLACTPSGRTVLAYEVDESLGDRGIAVRIMEPGTDTFDVRALVHDAENGEASHPRLVVAGDKLLLLHWVQSADADTWHLRTHLSLDEGSSWALVAEYATVEADIDGSSLVPGVIGAAHGDGQLLVVVGLESSAGTWANVLRQWASADLGGSFTMIESWNGADDDSAGAAPAIVFDQGWAVLYVNPAAGTSIDARRVGSAFQPISSALRNTGLGAWNAQIGQITGAALSDMDMAVTVDDVGVGWLIWRYAQTGGGYSSGRCGIVASTDGFRSTAEVMGVDPTDPTDANQTGVWWMAADPGTASEHYPTELACCWARGRLLVACAHAAPVTSSTGSISVLALGGPSTLSAPITRRGQRMGDRAHYWRHWLPFESPDSLAAWATSSFGVCTASLTTRLELTSAPAGGFRSWTATASAAATGSAGAIVEWACEVIAGGSTVANQVAVRIRVSDGATDGYEVVVRMTSTAIVLVDAIGGTTQSVTGLPAEARAYRLGISGDTGAARLYYRAYSALEEAREWSAGPVLSALGDDGGAGGDIIVQWGHIASGSSTTSHWYHLWWGAESLATGAQPVGTRHRWDAWDSSTAPSGLVGLHLGTRATFVADGRACLATRGPLVAGDAWRLVASYRWPLSRIWASESRSARVGWRAADDGEQIIALLMDPTLGSSVASGPGAAYWGLAVRGANWRTGRVQAYASGAWTTVAEIDLATGGALSFRRRGNTVGPNAANDPYFFAGELTGYTWASGLIRRRVVASSEGKWSNSTTGPRCSVTLDEVAALDPSTGTCRLWSPQGVVTWLAVEAAAYRLVIDAQAVVGGQIRLGSWLLGPCHVVARPPDWGVQDEIRPGHERRELADGSVVVANRVPPRRHVEVAWTDGTDESTAWGASPEPEGLAFAATAGSASPGAAAALTRSLRSWVWDHDGEQVALVLGVPAGDGVTLTRREHLLVGTMSSSARLEAVLGEEMSTQVNRLATFAFDEDP
jgi:hypothetical protein